MANAEIPIQEMRNITERLSRLSCAHEIEIRNEMERMRNKISVIEYVLRELKKAHEDLEKKYRDSRKELEISEEERRVAKEALRTSEEALETLEEKRRVAEEMLKDLEKAHGSEEDWSKKSPSTSKDSPSKDEDPKDADLSNKPLRDIESKKLHQEVMKIGDSVWNEQLKKYDESAFNISDLGLVFKETLHIQVQWKQLGIALGHISETELEEIEDHHFCDSRSLYEVLKLWIGKMFGTWEKLVEALSNEKVDQKQLADKIEKGFIAKKSKIDDSCPTLKPVENEKPITILKDEDFSMLFSGAGTYGSGLDWKVLGVFLKIPILELENIDSMFQSAEECQQAMIAKWISTWEAYWSVLVKILEGTAFDEIEIAENLAKKHLKSNYQQASVKKLSPATKIDKKSVVKYKNKILHALKNTKEKKQPNGIAVIIAVSESSGTSEDREKIEKVFKEFGFATYTFDSAPTATDVVSFAAAASRFEYPLSCKHRVLYIAGHGGFEIPTCNNDSTTSLPQAYFTVVKGKKVFIQRDILEVFKGLKPKYSFTLFFDCCLTSKKDLDLESYSVCVPPFCCFVAYGTSPGKKAIACGEGGLYTSLLCKELKKLEVGDPLSKAMDLTHEAMKKEMERRKEEEMRKKKDGAMKKRKPLTEKNRTADDDKKAYDHQALDDGKSDIHVDEEVNNYVAQQPIYMSSAGSIYFKGIKSNFQLLPLEKVKMESLQKILASSKFPLARLTLALEEIIGGDFADKVASIQGEEGAKMLLEKVMKIVKSDPYQHGSVVKIMKDSKKFPQLEQVMKGVQSTMTFEDVIKKFIKTLPGNEEFDKEIISKKLKAFLDNEDSDTSSAMEESFEESREYYLRERNEDGKVKTASKEKQ